VKRWTSVNGRMPTKLQNAIAVCVVDEWGRNVKNIYLVSTNDNSINGVSE
jgi:hypothetical protein